LTISPAEGTTHITHDLIVAKIEGSREETGVADLGPIGHQIVDNAAAIFVPGHGSQTERSLRLESSLVWMGTEVQQNLAKHSQD